MIWLLSGVLLVAIPYVFRSFPQEADGAIVARQAHCHSLQVLDGDTLKAVCAEVRVTLRLLGVDAPEMGQAPYGEQAREALRRRLPPDVHADISGQDIYGRALAVLHDSQGDINEWLVRQGFASVYRAASAPSAYVAAEKAARREKRGIWHQAGDQQNPQVWRRYHL